MTKVSPYIFFIIVALAVAIVSCSIDGAEEASEVTDKLITDAEGNIIEGTNRRFTPDGKLHSERQYKDGKLNGVSKVYYKHGGVKTEITYVDGKKHGYAKLYYDKGGVYTDQPFVKGKMHGMVKKFRENGKVMSEIEYKDGHPSTNISEYLVNGKKKTKYPTLVFEPVDRTKVDGTFVLKVSLSDKSKKVNYYHGTLEDEIYFHDGLEELYMAENGVLQIDYYLQPGQYLREELYIVAKANTQLRNPYLVSGKYYLAVER